MKDLQETAVDQNGRDESEKIIIDKSHYESIQARLSALEADRIPSDAFIAPGLYAMFGATQRDRKWSESHLKKTPPRPMAAVAIELAALLAILALGVLALSYAL